MRSVRTLELAGDHVATLRREPAQVDPQASVLHVHGFSDYFFQDHVAADFASRGYDFYALDLRRYGRSLRPGDVPAYVNDLGEYFEELDSALRAIRADGHSRLVVMAHSSGGLITPLWLHTHRGDPAVRDLVRALVLNSPCFELAEPWLTRTVGTWLLEVVARVRPHLNQRKLGVAYGHSLHGEHHGEWDFDLALKPLGGFPVLAGWLRVPVPVLVLRWSRSALRAPGGRLRSCAPMRARRRARVPLLAPAGAGRHGRRVVDGMHDLFLSGQLDGARVAKVTQTP